jgi:hypothetical protein
MAKKIKSKKKLKKIIARARMKRVQKIMNAARIHQENHQKTKAASNLANNKAPINQDLANKILNKKIKAIQGRISTARKRSRDKWLKR